MKPQPDTHCSRCGERLKPVPMFSSMQWECLCNGQHQIARRKGTLGQLFEAERYDSIVGTKIRWLVNNVVYFISGVDFSRRFFQVTRVDMPDATGPIPFDSQEVFELIN